MILLQQMILFAIMMALGFFSAKKSVLDKHVTKSISWVVVNIANPALILSGCLSGTTIERGELISIAILSFVIYFGMIAVSYPMAYSFARKKDERGLYQVMIAFSNMGFMGLPLMNAVYGPQSVMYISMFLIPFNVLVYTYGIAKIKDGTVPEKKDLAGNLLKIINPGVVASLLALIISLMGCSFTGLPVKLADMLGALTGPLSMMVIGASFVELNLKELFLDWKLYVYSFCKLILLPAVGMLIIKQFIDTTDLLGACFVVMAAPAASMSVMFSKQYRSEDQIATKAVAFSTLLSVVTMPLMMQLLSI